jgi:hypothetical protein
LFRGSPTTIAAGGAPVTFELRAKTTAVGTLTGRVEFGTSDADEPTYQLNLTAQIISATTLIDDGSTGYSDNGFEYWTGQGYGSDIRQSAANKGKTASWTFRGLDPNGVYQAAVTWTTWTNRATNARFTVDGDRSVTTLINQQLAPSSFSDQGFGWQNLTTMKPNAQGEIKISLTDQQANGYVLADAARLVRMFGPEIEVIENQTMVVSGSSRIDYGQVLVNASPSRTFTIRNIGADVLTLGTPIVPSGFAIVGSAPTTIAAGSEASLTLAVVSSATAASRSGDLTLPSNDADESSFRISVAANIVSSMVIDDGDVGFTSTSGFGLFGGQGFGNDVRAEFSPNGGDTANWTFRGIPAGTLLRVGATGLSCEGPFGARRG